ncbi:hypothetical protein CBM2615_B140195 [Cupriavidus taiwanensis]|uniref:Uncharacterized protein n=1 Tax=Cupriavidus taiwanensis TaxID=164546 RepID=A0A375EAG8_9BURK|nr:hypothetical protein CBM2614_B150137 [Cupriavidus taiwanensis]SOZ64358.1 hypothetical protein CBM2615_B140195 [Cupriavidus taiwanensis]SOZ68109.1 hypothetical protein CBM2613_B110195 [Cupriavidus taiwanensis]SPA07920.1 hypothetical protein CBM2625_B110195 [Cupriavidus taiwanensis]
MCAMALKNFSKLPRKMQSYVNWKSRRNACTSGETFWRFYHPDTPPQQLHFRGQTIAKCLDRLRRLSPYNR